MQIKRVILVVLEKASQNNIVLHNEYCIDF